MKKSFLIVALVSILLLGTGSLAYVTMAQGFNNFGFMQQMMGQGVNFEEMNRFMEDRGIDQNKINEVMNSGDQEAMFIFMQENNLNFGQMLPYMQKIHPELSVDEIKNLYQNCHGTVGSPNSTNFQQRMFK